MCGQRACVLRRSNRRRVVSMSRLNTHHDDAVLRLEQRHAEEPAAGRQHPRRDEGARDDTLGGRRKEVCFMVGDSMHRLLMRDADPEKPRMVVHEPKHGSPPRWRGRRGGRAPVSSSEGWSWDSDEKPEHLRAGWERNGRVRPSIRTIPTLSPRFAHAHLSRMTRPPPPAPGPSADLRRRAWHW